MPTFTFTGRGRRTSTFNFTIEVEADTQYQAERVAAADFAEQCYDETDSDDEVETFVAWDTVTAPTPYQPARAPAYVAPVAPAPAPYRRAAGGCYVTPQVTAPAPIYRAAVPAANGTSGVAVARVDARPNGYVPTRVRHTRA